jgi:hypothetical protein
MSVPTACGPLGEIGAPGPETRSIQMAVVGIADDGTELSPSFTAQLESPAGGAPKDLTTPPLERYGRFQCVRVPGPGTVRIAGAGFARVIILDAAGELREGGA